MWWAEGSLENMPGAIMAPVATPAGNEFYPVYTTGTWTHLSATPVYTTGTWTHLSATLFNLSVLKLHF